MDTERRPPNQADTILLLTDLKRIIGWGMGSLIIGAVSVGLHFQSRLLHIEEVYGKQGAVLAEVTQKIEFLRAEWSGIQTSIRDAQKSQSDIMVQLADLRATSSAMSANVQNLASRMEGLARYLQNNRDVLSDFDSIKSPRGVK